MRPTILLVAVAVLALSSSALAQGAGGLEGTGGLPEHELGDTNISLFDKDLASRMSDLLYLMHEAAAKCDRAGFDAALRSWNSRLSSMSTSIKFQQGLAASFDRKDPNNDYLFEDLNRQIADLRTLKSFQANSPDFPKFPIEKCAKKPTPDPKPPTPDPKPPTPDPKPPTPPKPRTPLTITHRSTNCPPCVSLLVTCNKLADDYSEAVNKDTLDMPLAKFEMEECFKKLEGCELQCTQPPYVPGATRPAPPKDRPAPPGGGAAVPGAGSSLFVHRQAACGQCQGTADRFNQAVDSHAAAVHSNAPNQTYLRMQSENLSHALDACEQRCVPHAAPATPRVGPGPTNRPGGGPSGVIH